MPRFLFSIFLFSILALTPHTASSINPRATLDQLKTLEILCFVPTWLPKGFTQKSIRLIYDEPGPDEGSVGRFPLYFIDYSGPGGASFTIDSAREGIGDRNIMETADTGETTITSPFGPMHLVYTPNTASSGSGRIDELKRHPQGGRRGATTLSKITEDVRRYALNTTSAEEDALKAGEPKSREFAEGGRIVFQPMKIAEWTRGYGPRMQSRFGRWLCLFVSLLKGCEDLVICIQVHE